MVLIKIQLDESANAQMAVWYCTTGGVLMSLLKWCDCYQSYDAIRVVQRDSRDEQPSQTVEPILMTDWLTDWMQRFHVSPRYPTLNPHSCMNVPISVPESIYLRCLICCPRVVGVAHLVSDPDCNKRTPRYRMILMTCEMPYNSSLCNLGCPLPCLAHYSKITSNPLQTHKNHTHTHTQSQSLSSHHTCVRRINSRTEPRWWR